MTTPIAPARPTTATGFALFNLGFRPFYPLAALAAAVGVALWALQVLGTVAPVGTVNGMAWHAHEMVFGFAVAVVTGFLFTAVRNWTGLPTPTGWPLAALCGLWLAGRIAVVAMPWPLAAAVDGAFLPTVALVLWLPLHRSRNRNRFMVGLLLGLAAANVAFHLSAAGLLAVPAIAAVRFALYLIVLLVTIMGGRVIPSFTANALREARVRVRPRLDRTAIATLAAALVSVLAFPAGVATGALCLAAAVLHAIRLAGWDPLSTRASPILWILHLSYAWIPLALLLHGLAAMDVLGTAVLADHAIAVGAVGGVIVGMITRTARGHTGLPLQASTPEVVAYALVHVAAGLRVLLPLAWPAAYTVAVGTSAAAWTVAFAIYLVVYVPILVRPRADGRPG